MDRWFPALTGRPPRMTTTNDRCDWVVWIKLGWMAMGGEDLPSSPFPLKVRDLPKWLSVYRDTPTDPFQYMITYIHSHPYITMSQVCMSMCYTFTLWRIGALVYEQPISRICVNPLAQKYIVIQRSLDISLSQQACVSSTDRRFVTRICTYVYMHDVYCTGVKVVASVCFTLTEGRVAVNSPYTSKFISEHICTRRARTRVCVCVYKLQFVRVAFFISYSSGGHLPPEAKSRFGRAWLSIMYNRDTSTPRWDRCLPSTCLTFWPRGMLSFMSTRARVRCI